MGAAYPKKSRIQIKMLIQTKLSPLKIYISKKLIRSKFLREITLAGQLVLAVRQEILNREVGY